MLDVLFMIVKEATLACKSTVRTMADGRLVAHNIEHGLVDVCSDSRRYRVDRLYSESAETIFEPVSL